MRVFTLNDQKSTHRSSRLPVRKDASFPNLQLRLHSALHLEEDWDGFSTDAISVLL